MARTKSPSGSKSKKEKVGVSGAVIPDANPMTAAEPPVSATAQAPEANVKAQAAAAGASAQSVVPTETRKFEVHKSEPRKNVVPINLEDEIRRRAYEIFQQRGQGAGNEADDWFAAEREVMQRYRQQRA